MKKKFLNHRLCYRIITALIVIFLPFIGIPVSAQPSAQDYAPIFYFESEETCYPIDADFQIQYSYLYEVDNPTVIATYPEAGTLGTYSSESYQYHYLDNQQGTIIDYNKIISDSQIWENSYGNTVYYRIDSSGITDVIQFWMFYAFNKGELNQHEGDWEMVQVVFINDKPSWVSYSQHHSGQWATWEQVEKEGNRIKVYVARGSHANYLRSYSGKIGVASDFVGANGRMLNPTSDYTLKSIESQQWLYYHGRWGVCGDNSNKFANNEVLGLNGPPGPMYREEGKMWNDPASWGKSGPQANDLMFNFEYFLYNFVLIYILITLIFLGLTAFLIYRRYKKYGLGPRILSMLYIDNLNLKSIGNILCIIGIIIAILGLFNTWYAISYDSTEIGSILGVEGGMQDIFKFDGINGIQMSIPGANGLMPVGTVSIPFSLIIGISLVFLIIATIGISHSKKLGWKYFWRGIRLIIPFILIIIVIMTMGSFITDVRGSDDVAGNTMNDIINSISSSPFVGEKTFFVTSEGVSVSIPMRWGIGLGVLLLLIAGIIIMVSGILEVMANTQFFIPKIYLTDKAQPKYSSQHHIQPQQSHMKQPPPKQPTQPLVSKKLVIPKEKPKPTFCGECGSKLLENATFCINCGKKI